MATSENIVFRGSRFYVVRKDPSTHAERRPREVVRHPGSVVILPMVDEQTVCLIRNFRVAVSETLIELPAGTREKDEDPATTALRELSEETGYHATRIEQIHAFYAAPGILDEWMTLFVATGLAPGEPHREPGEEIENLVIPWNEAVAMACDGRIKDAKTILGLLCYDRLRAV